MLLTIINVDWSKVLEDTIPLLTTGIGVLVFYYLKKTMIKKRKKKMQGLICMNRKN